MPNLKLVSVPLDRLVADPENARTHDVRNLAAIEDSLRQFGQVEPLLVQSDTNIVIGGNGRLEAMRTLGWETATVAYLDLTPASARRLSIALNRTSELAAWNPEVLIAQLQDMGDELPPGFSLGDLDELMHQIVHDVAEIAPQDESGEGDENEEDDGDVAGMADDGDDCVITIHLCREDYQQVMAIMTALSERWDTPDAGQTLLRMCREAQT